MMRHAPPPEMLFAALLDGLRDVYARDGMHGVICLVLAIAAAAPASAPTEDELAAELKERTPLDARVDDDVFSTLIATLEEKFACDGLDGALEALASIGRTVANGLDANLLEGRRPRPARVRATASRSIAERSDRRK